MVVRRGIHPGLTKRGRIMMIFFLVKLRDFFINILESTKMQNYLISKNNCKVNEVNYFLTYMTYSLTIKYPF